MTLTPDRQVLVTRLQAFVDQHDIRPKAPLVPWNSGVYAVLDCVFSCMADYTTVVLPTLERFGTNSGLHDQPDLTFHQFLEDVDNRFPGDDRFLLYATNIMVNRQQISGRTKVQVAYDVCAFFTARNFQTRAALQALPERQEERPDELVHLILKELVARRKVRGIGPALGRYLLMLSMAP